MSLLSDLSNVLLFLGVFTFIIISITAAYNSDGYGAAREPDNPGYRKARRYLEQYMAHRWPELRRGTKDSPPDQENT